MAEPRPPFQAPFPLGQTWDASTYAEHGPNPNSVDLAQRDNEGGNISEGEPVLASAEGTVLFAGTEVGAGGEEHRVRLDHGDGWTTRYYHLEEVPPLDVGQAVARGEQIGRTFNSGAKSMHIHYAQLLNGAPRGGAVRVMFDGELINTHEDNTDSYLTFGKEHAEEITSLNSLGNRFLAYSQSGQDYFLLYKPASGKVKIVVLGPNGVGAATTWEDEWTRQWTHLTPFFGATQWHAFLYKSSSGQAKFLRLDLSGDGVTVLDTESWGKGWTHFVPFRRGDRSYFLAYNSLYGHANIDRIGAASDRSETVFQTTWTKGWTLVAPFELGPSQHLLLYRGGTGEAKIVEVTGTGTAIGVSSTWSGAWKRGWTHLVPVTHEGARYLVVYRSSTGEARILKVKTGAQGVDVVATMSWQGSWTALTPFSENSKGHLLLYNAGSGAVKTVRFKAGGAGVDEVWSDAWTRGWT